MKSKAHQRQPCKLNGIACSRKFQKVAYNTKGLEDNTEKVSLRLMNKASPYSSSVVNTLGRRTRIMKAVEDKGKSQRMYLSSRKKVGARACSQQILGEDTNERVVTTYAFAASSEENDLDCDVCSVGSCSLNHWEQKELPKDFTKHPCLPRDSVFSDAESRCCPYDKDDICYEISKEKVYVNVHDLELHAYRSTLEVFYVSGPLSWEQEELLTNLRITLHISNDEHLIELRNLISSRTNK